MKNNVQHLGKGHFSTFTESDVGIKTNLSKPWFNHPKKNRPKAQRCRLNILIEIWSTVVRNPTCNPNLRVVNPSNFLLLVVKSTLQCCFSHQPSTMRQVIPTMHWLPHHVKIPVYPGQISRILFGLSYCHDTFIGFCNVSMFACWPKPTETPMVWTFVG